MIISVQLALQTQGSASPISTRSRKSALGLSTEVGEGGEPSMHNYISGDHPGLYQNGSETPRGQGARAAGTAGRMVRAAVM